MTANELIGDLVHRYPYALDALERHGIPVDVSEGLTLADASTQYGANLDRLLNDLKAIAWFSLQTEGLELFDPVEPGYSPVHAVGLPYDPLAMGI